MPFNTLLCYSKFTHSCRVSEQQEGKRKRQVMPPLVLLIKFILLLIIFSSKFLFNLLVANWRLCQNFGHQLFFPLAMVTKMVAAWSALKLPFYRILKGLRSFSFQKKQRENTIFYQYLLP